MDRYVKGLLTAYDRILNLIAIIDPENRSIELECLKSRILASVYAYKMFLAKEDLEEYELHINDKLSALEGSLTIEEILKILDYPNAKNPTCKIIELPADYLNDRTIK